MPEDWPKAVDAQRSDTHNATVSGKSRILARRTDCCLDIATSPLAGRAFHVRADKGEEIEYIIGKIRAR
jgi:hypothetical protein